MTFRSMTLPLFALVAALAGCSAEAGTSGGAESVDDVRGNIAAEQADAPEGRRAHGRPGHGAPGPDLLVHAALRAPIDLSAEQRATIEGLVKSRTHERPAFDSTHAAKLAAAVRSNSVAGLTPPAHDESAKEARIAASAKALATLHDTLTPAQRVALVDGITKRAADHGPMAKARGEHGPRGDRASRGDHGPRGDRANRGEVGPRGDHADRGGRAGHFRGPGGHGGAPMHLLAGLDLTEEQRDAIKAKLEAERPEKPSADQREAMKAKHEAMRAAMQAKLESFKGDSFDAAAFVTPPKELPRPAAVEDHRMHELAIVTSVLTPAQREALATRIEQGPAKAAAPVKAPRPQ
ncbi:MAG: hypothetical protein KF850_28860 [Labilithrix sp.]|nr:hypothetical protein [Labilithrix sp.]